MTSVGRRYATSASKFEHPSETADPERGAPVVLMVSGGADSTALLVMAATSTLDIDDGRGQARIARERLHVLHFNHQLRGLDAQEDEEFVRELAARFGIPITVRTADVAAHAAQTASNIEEVGREFRYAAAAELANKLCEQAGISRSAARIVTAHTADDRAETFLMNAIRGSGPSGLASIPRRRNRIVRPLLDRTHEELCEYLRMRGLVWREDATNADTRYLRAYVRHEVLPTVRERNQQVVSSLATTCDILSDEDAYLTSVAARTLRDLTLRRDAGTLILDAARLATTDVAIARRVVRAAILQLAPGARLEARHVASVLKLVAAGTGSVSVPMGVSARVEFGLLSLRARIASDDPVSGWLEVPGTLGLGGGRHLTASLVELPQGVDAEAQARAHASEWDNASVLLDAATCGLSASGGQLWVSGPTPGELICPLGMHGQSKKLSDLLGEARVPVAERPFIPIVRVSPHGPLVWVAGIRADERSKCTPSSRLLVKLSVVDSEEGLLGSS